MMTFIIASVGVILGVIIGLALTYTSNEPRDCSNEYSCRICGEEHGSLYLAEKCEARHEFEDDSYLDEDRN